MKLLIIVIKFYYKEPYHTSSSEILSGAVVIGPTVWAV